MRQRNYIELMYQTELSEFGYRVQADRIKTQAPYPNHAMEEEKSVDSEDSE